MAEKEKRESGPDKSADRGPEAALQPGETRFHELFKHIGSGVAIYEAVDDGADFVFRDLNPAAEKIDRILREDILGRRVTEVFPGVKELGVFEVFQRVWRTGTPEYFPAHLYSDARDVGSWKENWVFKLPTGEIVAVYNDITERVRAEETLRESEEQLRAFMENAPDGVYLNDLAGVFLYGNRRTEEITGFRREEIIGKSMMELDLLFPDGLSKAAGLMQASSRGESTGPDELTLRRKDGSAVVVEINTSIVRRYGQQVVMGFVRDVTERKRAEDAVQTALREKGTLLQEIHHRVKNNMQVISSLFNLQAGQITAENARRVLKEGQTRIRSMALIHEKLYQSRDLSKIDFADYLRSLAAHLFHSFRVEADRIRLETDLEIIHLSINSAVPCGLLATELITNAIQYAFPAGRKGVVRLGLRRRPDSSVELRVADDGVGLPESLDFRRTESLGLQIVTLLVNQLDGTIALEGNDGTAFVIAFREQSCKPRS